MAWKSNKLKNEIIKILEEANLNYNLDSENSRIMMHLECDALEYVDIIIGIDETFIGFVSCFNKEVESKHLDASLKLINLINSHLYFNDAYMYMADDFIIHTSGSLYFGDESNLDEIFIQLIQNILVNMLNNMCTLDKAFKLIESGYDAYSSYNAVK